MRDGKDGLIELLELRARSGSDISPVVFRNLLRSEERGMTHVFKSDLNRAIGYVAWANISKESLVRLRNDGVMPNLLGEWEEGHVLLLIDIILLRGTVGSLRDTLTYFARNRRVVIYLRRGCLWMFVRRGGAFQLTLRKRFYTRGAPAVPSKRIINSPAL
jgi:hypothetical protein